MDANEILEHTLKSMVERGQWGQYEQTTMLFVIMMQLSELNQNISDWIWLMQGEKKP